MEWVNHPILLLVVMISFTLVVLLHILLHRRGGRHLPPGPMGLPLLGRLPFLTPDLHRCFADLAHTYGPILSFRLGTKLCVVLTSPSTATEVFRVHDAVFANHPSPGVATIATGNANIVWAPYGPHWRMVRKVAAHELLSISVVDCFKLLRRKEVNRLVHALQSNKGDAVNIRNVVYAVFLNVLTSMLWGGELVDGRLEEAREMFDGYLDLLGVLNISDFLPVIAPLDLQGLHSRTRRWCKWYDAFFDRLKKSKEEEKSCSTGNGAKDFLQLMLDLVAKDDPDMPFKFEHAKYILMDMMLAAPDATTTTTTWAMSELLRNPKVMAKAQQELDTVVGSNAVLEESDLPKLRYLAAVMKETLRLHPLLPLLVPHTPSRNCIVGGYDIPEGTRVFINVWAIHRDPSLWEEPLEFKPERFLEQDGRWDYHGKSLEYFPFGCGRRMCPAINTAERMVMYVLGTLLHAFEWKIPQGAKGVDVDEKPGIVLKKKEPLVLVPSIRMEQYTKATR